VVEGIISSKPTDEDVQRLKVEAALTRDYAFIQFEDDAMVIVSANGRIAWFWKGMLHREGGPALIYPSGSFRYYRHSKLHREDGPASKTRSRSEWWLDGKIYLREEDFQAALVVWREAKEAEPRTTDDEEKP